MFTGLVKEIGKVASISKRSALTKIGINSKEVSKEADIGDSISINGVCLTVTTKDRDIISFDAVKPTLEKSNLKRLKINDPVNLEPALKLQEKLGGHFVLGHVDGEVLIRRLVKQRDFYHLEISIDANAKKYLVDNGSVALDGVSLTIKDVKPSYFTVDIIPFTYENTAFKYKRAGSWLNIEYDYLLKRR